MSSTEVKGTLKFTMGDFYLFGRADQTRVFSHPFAVDLTELLAIPRDGGNYWRHLGGLIEDQILDPEVWTKFQQVEKLEFTDQDNKTTVLFEQARGTAGNRFVCTAARPWSAAEGEWSLHPDAKHVKDDYDTSANHSDYEISKCPHCGTTIRSELPN